MAVTEEQVQQGKARAGGNATVTNKKVKSSKTKSPDQLVKKVSKEAKDVVNNAPGGTSGKIGLTGVPYGTKIRVGKEVTSQPPQFAGGRPVETKTPIFKTTQYDSTSAAILFASLSANEKAELLLNLSNIPGLYSKGEAPTREYVLKGLTTKQLGLRPEDKNAIESVMYYADSIGEDVQTSIRKFVANPTIAQNYFNMKGEKPERDVRTPQLALATEIDQSMRDFLDTKASKEVTKAYADRVNKLELQRGGSLTQLERQQILTDFIQDEAKNMFAAEADNPDSMLTRKGALGGTFNYLKKIRSEYGVNTSDKVIYKEAIKSIRSQQALENIVNKIQLQAEVNMPSLKSYFQQGLNAREALGNYISLRSKVFGVDENSISIDDLAPVYAGTNLMSINDYQKYLFKTPEFKNSPLYKQQQLDDYKTLVRNFIGQVTYGTANNS